MIKRCISFELKRAFDSIGTKISLAIGSVIVLLDAFTFYAMHSSSSSTIMIQAWIGTDFRLAYNGLYYIVFPILACLPFAGSYYEDIARGYDKNICVRISRRQYMLAKCIAVYASAFVCVVVPLLLNLFIVAGLYPNGLPNKLDFLSAGVIDCYRFSLLFNQSPLIYCLVFILVDGLFAGALGLVSVAVARLCRSQFAAVVTPFVAYILTGVLMINDSGYSVSVMDMVNPLQTYLTTTAQMCAVFLLIMAAASSAIWYFGRRRDIL